jgi:hypothetical protein
MDNFFQKKEIQYFFFLRKKIKKLCFFEQN